MQEIPIETDASDPSTRAEIDRCASCGGVFLEFFDGEPSALARGLEKRSDLPPTGGRGHGGDHLCPDCGEPMVIRPYLDQGPAIPRCETCLAVFLTPALRHEMAQLRLAREPEESEERGWMDRLMTWLDRV